MQSSQQIIGITVLALLATGIISLIMAFIAAINGDWSGVGLSLIAASLAFGLLLNALLR